MEESYTNYGDISPLKYGGIWVNQLNEHVFDIIKSIPITDEFLNINYHFVDDLEININDSWINREELLKFAEMTENNINPLLFAIALSEYYSPENFGTTSKMTTQELREFLKCRGIEV